MKNKKSLTVGVLGVASLLVIAASPAVAMDDEAVDCFYAMNQAHPACHVAKPTVTRSVTTAPQATTESTELAEGIDCFYLYNAVSPECAAPNRHEVARNRMVPGSV
jgi:hypothetical protein